MTQLRGVLAKPAAPGLVVTLDIGVAQACEMPTGGDYDKLRAHIQGACVEAYHRKASFVEEKEGGLMQASVASAPLNRRFF